MRILFEPPVRTEYYWVALAGIGLACLLFLFLELRKRSRDLRERPITPGRLPRANEAVPVPPQISGDPEGQATEPLGHNYSGTTYLGPSK